jgi:hypothetical protein
MRSAAIALGLFGLVGADVALAQYGDAIPIGPGGRCPSNYTIQQGMCRPYRQYREDRYRGDRDLYRERDLYDGRGYREGRRRDRDTVPPRVIRGSVVCPENYDLHRGMCVSRD